MKNLLTVILAFIAAISFAQPSKTGDYHLDQDYKVSPTGTIRLNVSDAKVYITGSDRATANVKIDREIETRGMVFGDEEFSVEVSEDNGNLAIRQQSSGNISIVGSMHERYTVKILAPKGVSLIINGDDGDYFITTINGAIDADMDDADLELTGCGGSDFKFRIDDGDVKMDQGKGSLAIDGDDTNVDIRNAQFTKISAEIDDGDFVVETSLVDNGDYFINTQDGRISFTVTSGGGRFDVRHDDASVRVDNAFNSVEESEDRSRYTLASGNAKVDIRADDASIRLAKK